MISSSGSIAGCRSRGINASRMAGDRLESGLLFAPGPDEIKILEPRGAKPSQIPVVSIGSLLNRELGSWTNQWVHINGLVVSYRPGESLTVKDPTGVIRARVIQLTEIRGDERVDVVGLSGSGTGRDRFSTTPTSKWRDRRRRTWPPPRPRRRSPGSRGFPPF